MFDDARAGNCISLLYMGCGFYSQSSINMAKAQNAKTLYLQAKAMRVKHGQYPF
jgi:hypothetical protein